MLITASVPAFNSESTITETILSLSRQSYPFFKIKVYDNKSTDSTRSIIKQLMSEISNLELIENDVNVGAEANFTRCISEAEGDLCVIAHADDIYLPEFSKEYVEFFKSNPDLSAAFCLANEIDGKGDIIGRRYLPAPLKRPEYTVLSKEKAIGLFYKYGNFVTCPSVVARSDIFRNHIKNWDGTTYNTSADLDVWFRLLEVGKFGFINKPLINYRVAEASYSYRVAKVRTHKHDLFKVLEAPKNSNYMQKNLSELNFLLNKDYANRFLNVLRTRNKEMIKAFTWDCDFKVSACLKSGLSSSWHLKMMAAILGLRALFKLKAIL
tara:strand:+ start:21220 stop:22191 length:972 start_codon:yes stop_codon:yes gene_type:complete